MKVLGALFAVVLIVSTLAVAMLVQLAITLAPFLFVAMIVTLVLRARRHPPPPAVADGWQGRAEQVRAVGPPPQYVVGVPAAAPHGWTLVPVWVPPVPRRPVIDAEVIGDDG